MKYRILTALAFALIVGAQPSLGFAGEKLTLYKNPMCTCCESYAKYMRDNGFDVTVVPTPDLVTFSAEHGIPASMSACHVSLVGGYAIGGHVPVDVVKRLLAEKPPLKAITVTGMPTGVPGMPGPKTGPLTIYAIAPDGKSSVYATE